MSRPERHVDDITDMRRSCRLRENTSVRRPLGSSSRLLKVPIVFIIVVIIIPRVVFIDLNKVDEGVLRKCYM